MAKGVLAEVLSTIPSRRSAGCAPPPTSNGQHLAAVANTVVHGAPSARITLFAELPVAPSAQ